MKMIEDLAHDAFQAARAGELGPMRAAVADIVATTPTMVDTAVQLWLDRLIVIIGDVVTSGGQLHLKIEMLDDDSSTGQPQSLAELRDEIAWVGYMFAAYTVRDVDAWRQLWARVPAGQLNAYVERLLNTMAKTTLAYEEAYTENPPAEQHGILRQWILDAPATTGNRLAKSHLN